MKTPQVKPSQRKQVTPPPPASQKKDWKENPLVVSALAIVGTASLFGAVIMPITNTILNNRIERLTEISANAEATAQELVKTKKELVSVRADLFEISAQRPFAPRSVYPLGYNNVRIASDSQEALSQIPGLKWDEDKSYLSTSQSGDQKISAAFRGVAYYFDKNGKVRNILYHFDFDKSAEWAELTKRHLTREFGEPYATHKRDSLWFIKEGEWAAVEETTKGRPSYHVYYEPLGFQWLAVESPKAKRK